MTTRSCSPLWVLGLALLLAMPGAARGGEPGLWVLSSLAKPLPSQPTPDFLVQFECEPEIRAARGESEALQLLVLAPAEGLRALRAESGAFVGPAGERWAPGTLRCDFVGYVTTQKPYYGTLRVGEWPDPLLAARSVDVPAGHAQPIWVEIDVPRAAKPGRYQGELLLSATGWTKRLPLTVEVWDFELPLAPSLPSSFLLRVRYLYDFHKLERGTPAAEAMIRRYHESMLAHRIMPTHVGTDEVHTRPELTLSDDGRLRQADFRAFDAKIEWAMARGQTHFGHEGPRRINPLSEGNWRAIADHLREKGWLDRFYTYLADETYEGVAEVTAMVNRAAPDLKNLITQLPKEGFPDVDLWCPRLGDAQMHARDIGHRLKLTGRSRKDLWVYTAGNAGSDVPALHLDVPGIEARVSPLAIWTEGYGGFLFWCVNYWTVDPWLDPMVYPRQNGNGSLYYPGPEGPLPAVRLKLLRDGFDDVDYAALLDARQDPLATHILEGLPVRSALDWPRDPRPLLAWRQAAGCALAGQREEAKRWLETLAGLEKATGGAERAVTSLGQPGRGWHGARDGEERATDSGAVYAFTLDADKSKLWRLASPADWSGYREARVRVKLVEGEPVRLLFKLGNGIIQRTGWTWEIHCAPGEPRDLLIPIPHEMLDTTAIRELSLFIWEPKSARRFELSGIWLR
ncbi:DUF4091 domain-containing protein [bacterium]|nr:DUF4091 domain-containing protein [bacterium]